MRKIICFVAFLSMFFLNSSSAFAKHELPSVSIEARNVFQQVNDPANIPIKLFFATDEIYSIYSITIENDESYITQAKTFFLPIEKKNQKPKTVIENVSNDLKEKLLKFRTCSKRKLKSLEKDQIKDILLNQNLLQDIIHECLLDSSLVTKPKSSVSSSICNCGEKVCLCGEASLCKNGRCDEEQSCNCDKASHTCECPFEDVCLRGQCAICPPDRQQRCGDGTCLGRGQVCSSFQEECPNGFEDCNGDCSHIFCIQENLDDDPANDCVCSIFVRHDGVCAVIDNCPIEQIDFDCTRARPHRCRYNGPYLVCAPSESECPPCPPGFTLCMNGTCVRNIEQCDLPVPCQGLVRCPDNTCRTSDEGCPCVGCLGGASVYRGRDEE